MGTAGWRWAAWLGLHAWMVRWMLCSPNLVQPLSGAQVLALETHTSPPSPWPQQACGSSVTPATRGCMQPAWVSSGRPRGSSLAAPASARRRRRPSLRTAVPPWWCAPRPSCTSGGWWARMGRTGAGMRTPAMPAHRCTGLLLTSCTDACCRCRRDEILRHIRPGALKLVLYEGQPQPGAGGGYRLQIAAGTMAPCVGFPKRVGGRWMRTTSSPPAQQGPPHAVLGAPAPLTPPPTPPRPRPLQAAPPGWSPPPSWRQLTSCSPLMMCCAATSTTRLTVRVRGAACAGARSTRRAAG